MILNQQRRYALPRSALHAYVRALRRRLRLSRHDFNLCFVDDAAIRKLNSAYRGKDRATDVLSFPWSQLFPGNAARQGIGQRHPQPRQSRRGTSAKGTEFHRFLGDIVISTETARRNARAEGHSTLNEIRWLVLHGVLHLLGYDHQCDNGEMAALELALREELGIAGGRPHGRNR